nr:MAG TPA: hypothetical protein [Crassvirales sp.]
MSLNNGKITAPVSIDDVKRVLGESSNDLATLCKSENINIWSKRKPVSLNALFPNINGDWYKGNINNDYYNGKECYGIRKNGINLAEFTTNSNILYNNHFAENPHIYYVSPSGGSESPYRLGDFNGYNNNTPNYDKTGNKPYNDNVNITLTSGGALVTSANFTYNYNGYGDFLGLKDMFGGGDLYLGIIVEAASNAMLSPEGVAKTLRINPLSAAYIGDKIDGTANNSTGLTYTARCVTPAYNYNSSKPSETSKYFSTQEYIKVVACVVKKNDNKNVWFFPIAYKWIVPGGAIDLSDYCSIENCKIRATVTKNSDGSYWVYINKYDDFVGNVIAPNNGNSILKFVQPMQFTPNDGKVTVKTMRTSKLVNEGEKVSTSSFNAYNVSNWQSSNPTNTMSMQFTVSSGTASVTLSFGFTIKSGLEKTKRYSALITINLPSSGNSTTSEWVNVK